VYKMPGKMISKSKEPGLAALAKKAPEAVKNMGKDPNKIGMMRGGPVKMMRGGPVEMMRGGKVGYADGGCVKVKTNQNPHMS
jgi:hypothetical protein